MQTSRFFGWFYVNFWGFMPHSRPKTRKKMIHRPLLLVPGHPDAIFHKLKLCLLRFYWFGPKKKLAWGIPRIFSANVCSPLTNKGLASPVNVQAQSHWRWRLCGHGDAMDSSHVPLGNKVLSIQIKSWKYHRNMKLIAVNQPPQSRRGNASFATLTSFTPVATARLSACAAACSLSTHPLTNESHLQRVCKKMAPLNGFEKKWFKKNSAVFLFRYLLLL